MQMRTRMTTSRRGFTLVELLVAVALSAVVVLAVYAVLISSSRTFRIQGDIAQATDQMHFAVDTMRADLARSGFMVVPNAYLDEAEYSWFESVCAPPSWLPNNGSSGVAHSIFYQELETGASSPHYLPRTEDRVTVGEAPDRFALLGAYRTTRSYRPISMGAGSQSFIIQHTPDESAEMEWRFEGSMLAITSPQGGTQYLRVADVEPGVTTTTLTTSAPLLADPSGGVNTECAFQGFGSRLYELTPLHFVEYSIQNDPDDPESTVLVREELDASYQPFNPPSRYVVARNVIDLQLWFDGADPTPGATAVQRDLNPLDTVGSLPETELDGDGTARPEDARMAYVQVSVRLDEPMARGIAEGSGIDLREFVELRRWNGSSYTYDGDFTRVLTMRAEADLANFSLRDLE